MYQGYLEALHNCHEDWLIRRIHKSWNGPAADRVQVCVLYSDVLLETRVLVSRRLKDKNESLDLSFGSCSLGLEHLVLVSVLKKMSCSFSRLLF